MEKIYVLGHKKPDTDSIAAAISLSNLKNELGIPAEPRTLGNLNNETKFALDYFNETEPKYLNDVKLQLKDIDYHKNFHIKGFSNMIDLWQTLLKLSLVFCDQKYMSFAYSFLLSLMYIKREIIPLLSFLTMKH